MRTALVIDGPSMFARAYYVAPDNPYVGLTGTVRNLFDRTDPDLLLWAWDGDHRKSAKNRKDKPADYKAALAAARRQLHSQFGGTLVISDGEADDACASAAVQERKAGNSVVIVTSDGDMEYLCVDGIRVYDLVNKRFKTREDVLAKWHVHRLSHVPLVKSMVGDSGDGIGGVQGIGIKKACKLYADTVSSSMAFEAARQSVRSALSETQRDEFDDALRAIMLYTDLEIPRATPLKMFEL